MKHGVMRAKVYQFICDFRKEHGYSPSYREISEALGISLSTVDHHVFYLASYGKISYEYGKARSIVVL